LFAGEGELQLQQAGIPQQQQPYISSMVGSRSR